MSVSVGNLRYRIELRRPNLAPLILEEVGDLNTVYVAFSRQVRRLEDEHAGGFVIAIDQTCLPEQIIVNRWVRPKAHFDDALHGHADIEWIPRAADRLPVRQITTGDVGKRQRRHREVLPAT